MSSDSLVVVRNWQAYNHRNRDPYFLKEKRMGHMPTFMDSYFPIKKLAALLPPARSHKHGLQCQQKWNCAHFQPRNAKLAFFEFLASTHNYNLEREENPFRTCNNATISFNSDTLFYPEIYVFIYIVVSKYQAIQTVKLSSTTCGSYIQTNSHANTPFISLCLGGIPCNFLSIIWI